MFKLFRIISNYLALAIIISNYFQLYCIISIRELLCKLKDYNAIKLIDDVHHLLQYHYSDETINYNELCIELCELQSDCIYFKRSQRDTHNKFINISEKQQLFATNNNTDFVFISVLDRAHVLLLHQHNETEIESINQTKKLLKWNEWYEWTSNDVIISNEKSTAELIESKVVQLNGYSSPLIITLSTTLSDKYFTVSNYLTWNVFLNCTTLWNSLQHNTNINNAATLEFDFYLFSFPKQYAYLPQQHLKHIIVTIYNTTIHDNEAVAVASALQFATSMDIKANATIILNNVKISSNTQIGQSVAVSNSQDDFGVMFICNNCKFLNNKAYASAASLMVSNIVIHCNECVFDSNVCQSSGSAIWMRHSQLYLNNSVVKNNINPLGGALFVRHSFLFFYSCNFSNNSAERGSGAAVLIIQMQHLLTELIISKNKYSIDSLPMIIDIQNTIFDQNVAFTNGGAISIILVPAIRPTARMVSAQRRRNLLALDDNLTFSCIILKIIPDFHKEDIYWSLKFDNNTIYNGTVDSSINNCIPMPTSDKCFEFTIYDNFGDGINYGKGSYFLNWTSYQWRSLSEGDYGKIEQMRLCDPLEYDSIQKITVFVERNNNESEMFLRLLDEYIIPLMYQTLSYDIIYLNNTNHLDIVSPAFSSHYNDALYELNANDIVNIKSLLETIHTASACENVELIRDIIDHICIFYDNIKYEPYLCQAIDCDLNDCYYQESSLTYRSKTSYGNGALNFEAFDGEPIRVSDKILIDLVPATLYGYIEYTHGLTTSNKCFNVSDLLSDTFNPENINNSIPILAANLDKCVYSKVLKTFQEFGARAVVVVTNINSDSPPPTASPTNPPTTDKLNYIYWLPFKCYIETNNIQFTTQWDKLWPNITWYVETMFQTDVTNINSTHVDETSIQYRFYANTTSTKLNHPIVNTVLQNTLLIALNAYSLHYESITVICSHSKELNESFSSKPTPMPTNQPTIMPVMMTRIATVDFIFIPVALVNYKEALQLVKIASVANNELHLGFWCDTSDPTSTPTLAPTTTPTEYPTAQQLYNTSHLVILGYNEDSIQPSTVITFTLTEFYSFDYVMSFCNISLPFENPSEYKVWFAAVETVYTNMNEICIQDNNDDITLETMGVHKSKNIHNNNEYMWYLNEQHNMSCVRTENKLNTNKLDKGTYCFALWRLVDDENNGYHFHMKKLFHWTPTFVSINNCNFTKNGVFDKYGGAISITSETNMDEFLSVRIRDSVFDSNFAPDGGTCLYRLFSYSGIYLLETNYMSIIEMDNVVMLNSKSNAIYSNLNSYINDGFFVKNAMMLTNIMIWNSNNSNGGAIELHKSNVLLKDSLITNSSAMDGGGIYIDNTMFQLFNTTVSHNKAINNGGGLYMDQYDKYEKFPLCLSLFYSDFINNFADNDGGAISASLWGSDDNPITNERESCFRIMDINFENNLVKNGNHYFFLNITPPMHRFLWEKGIVSTICDHTIQDCSGFGSSVSWICASHIFQDCNKWIEYPICLHCDMWKQPVPEVIQGYPQSSITLYIFAWNVFNNPIKTDQYMITVESKDAIVLAPNGISAKHSNYSNMIPIVVVRSGNISIKEKGKVLLEIPVEIKDCKPGEYKQYHSDDETIYECVRCEVGYYSLSSQYPCRSCENKLGIDCYGENRVVMRENWYGLTLADGEIETGICPPGICCADSNGCDFSDKNTLCAVHRNSSVKLCGRCQDGYHETLQNSGDCKDCKYGEWYWIVIWFIISCIIVIILYTSSRKERTVPHPFVVYISRTMLFFYQIFMLINYRHDIGALQVVCNIANIDLDFNPKGTCLFLNVTAKQKVFLKLIPSLSLLVAVGLLFLIMKFKYLFGELADSQNKYKIREQWKKELIPFQSIVDFVISYVYVQLVYVTLTSCICVSFGDGMYQWYAGTEECWTFDEIIGIIMAIFLIFILPFLSFKYQRYVKYNKPDRFEKLFAGTVLLYREKCWWWSSFDLFRRGILVLLPMIPTYNVSARSVYIPVVISILLAVHCIESPYQWRANNYLETVVLLLLCTASVMNIPKVPTTWMNVLVKLCGYFPFVFVPWLGYQYYHDKIHKVYTFMCGIRCQRKETPHGKSAYFKFPKSGNKGITVYQANYHQLHAEEASYNSIDEINPLVSGTTFSAKPTRTGWKYPWKECFKRGKKTHVNQENEVFMEGIITFSNAVPANTFIDTAQAVQHLRYYLQQIGCSVELDRITGSGTKFTIFFHCQWMDDKFLSEQLIKVSRKLAMETAISETLENNDSLLKDLRKCFTLKSREHKVKIIQFKCKGSFSSHDKDEVLIREIKSLQQIERKQAKQEMIEKNIDILPLHYFDPEHLCIVIKSWILNDSKYITDSKAIMETLSEKYLSGKKLKALDSDLKVVLHSAISQFMTQHTFNLVFDRLEQDIKQNNTNIIGKRAPVVASDICEYPWGRLLESIKHGYINEDTDIGHINGELFMQNYGQTVHEWIKRETGWSQKEIDQLCIIIGRNKTRKKSVLRHKIKKAMVSTFNKDVTAVFLDLIETIDLEQLELKIKIGKRISEEIEIIADFIGELESEYGVVVNKRKLSPGIYNILAETFKNEKEWSCAFCINSNHPHYVGAKLQRNIKICTLCGLDVNGSIKMALKGNQYRFKHHVHYDLKSVDEIKDDNHLEILILEELNDSNLNIDCPDGHENVPCYSLLKMGIYLKRYQEWMEFMKKAKGTDDIDVTVDVNVAIVNHEVFVHLVMESAETLISQNKLNGKLLNQLLIDDKLDGASFNELKKKQFGKQLMRNKICKMGIASKLYNDVHKKLIHKAQEIEIGQNLQPKLFKNMEQHYQHILNDHILNANNFEKENVFIYFESIIACDLCHLNEDEKNNQIGPRKERRLNPYLDNIDINKTQKQWLLEQVQIQTSMETYHQFLCHHIMETGSKHTIRFGTKSRFTQRSPSSLPTDLATSINSETKECDIIINPSEIELLKNATLVPDSFGNEQKSYAVDIYQTQNEKFISTAYEYGFGIDHSYAYLKPVFNSMREEMLKNKQCEISSITFDRLLTKALEKRNNSIEKLKCTHYTKEYNLIRNEEIGIRHILALVIYTDCSSFCTFYRGTYRRLKENESETSVTRRHVKIYYYSRFLFAAIESFGTQMSENDKVYHGLNKLMVFDRFTAYFNQPVSTTMDRITALKFAGTNGIIVTLKRGTSTMVLSQNQYEHKATYPKYLDVAWLSAYPEEKERLFYGENLVFQIADIYEMSTKNTYKSSLYRFNIFQRMVKNHNVNWDEISKKCIIKLVELITNQIERGNNILMNDIDEKNDDNNNGSVFSVKLENI
eukprot:117027_1